MTQHYVTGAKVKISGEKFTDETPAALATLYSVSSEDIWEANYQGLPIPSWPDWETRSYFNIGAVANIPGDQPSLSPSPKEPDIDNGFSTKTAAKTATKAAGGSNVLIFAGLGLVGLLLFMKKK